MKFKAAFCWPIFFSFTVANAQYSLSDFYAENQALSQKVDSVFNSLLEDEKIAQIIFTSIGELGKPLEHVQHLVDYGMIGGIVLLNNTKTAHVRTITDINARAKKRLKIPPLFGLDAEPSLFKRRMQNATPVSKTNEIKDSLESDMTATIISQELKNAGFHINFAPVIDIGTDNEAIGSRSFGSDPRQVVSLSNAFIQASQSCEIVNVAKHFPGHGLVSGDTHKDLVYIDGDLKEIKNYGPIIENGVIAIMIGHLGIKNNALYDTKNLPATCSKKIVTDLLKDKMGFEGLVITDAMNMKAIAKVEKAPLAASLAGCDIILMPKDELWAIEDIKYEMMANPIYHDQVYKSIKKVLRLKFCLGILI